MFKVFKTPEFKKALGFYTESIKDNKKNFIISMASATAWVFLVIVQPYLIKRIIDDGIVSGNQSILIVLISFMVLAGYVRAISIGTRRYYGMHVCCWKCPMRTRLSSAATSRGTSAFRTWFPAVAPSAVCMPPIVERSTRRSLRVRRKASLSPGTSRRWCSTRSRARAQPFASDGLKL